MEQISTVKTKLPVMLGGGLVVSEVKGCETSSRDVAQSSFISEYSTLPPVEQYQVTRSSTEPGRARFNEGAPADAAGGLVINTGIASGENDAYGRISRRFKLQDVASHLLKNDRLFKCLRVRYSNVKGVGVNYSDRVKRAHYSNLITCGLPWVCPVCAAKISERRRIELTEGVDRWRKRGGAMILVTLTMSHDDKDPLEYLLNDMNKAYRKVKSGRWWQEVVKTFEVAGSVTAHEITYGQVSGFHPHKHILFFLNKELSNLDKFRLWFVFNNRWQECLSFFGRYASDEVAVDVKSGFGACGDYVTKWGLVEEVTKTNSKVGRSLPRSKHYSPFQLLDLVDKGSTWAGKVFVEYAAATKGRNQLTWSPGMRELLELGQELTDQEIVDRVEEKAVLLLELCWPEWRRVLRAHARAQLLDVASTGHKEYVITYLSTLGVYIDEGGVPGG